MSLKLENLTCARADFAKFIYKTLDICSQRLFPFALCYAFPFLVQLFVGIYEIYLRFDLGPLALISILFVNIAIVIYFIENVYMIANVKEINNNNNNNNNEFVCTEIFHIFQIYQQNANGSIVVF